MAQVLGGFIPWLADSKAELWKKGTVEQSCSLHGGQDWSRGSGRENGARDINRRPSQHVPTYPDTGMWLTHPWSQLPAGSTSTFTTLAPHSPSRGSAFILPLLLPGPLQSSLPSSYSPAKVFICLSELPGHFHTNI